MTALYIILAVVAVIMLLLLIPADCILEFSYNNKENNGSVIPSAQEAQDLSVVFSEFHKETLLRPVFPQKQAGHRPHPSEDLSR